VRGMTGTMWPCRGGLAGSSAVRIQWRVARAEERWSREREDKIERGGATFIYRTETLAVMG
jgi:hypothetical protein